jgi:8-oxo-dGTP diphosphatase
MPGCDHDTNGGARACASVQPGCIFGVVGVLERDGHFLLIQRSRFVRAPGKWCFAGGAIEPGESPADAIVREYREELGMTVEAGEKLWSWLREDGRLHLEWRRVRWVGGSLRINPLEVSAIRWMSDADIRAHPEMIANNVVFLDHLRSA